MLAIKLCGCSGDYCESNGGPLRETSRSYRVAIFFYCSHRVGSCVEEDEEGIRSRPRSRDPRQSILSALGTLSADCLVQKLKEGTEVCEFLEHNVIQAELKDTTLRMTPCYRLKFRPEIEINDGHFKGKTGKCC